MQVVNLDLKATTPLELYFETSLKNCNEHFMMAFVIAGYTEAQLVNMNKSIERLIANKPRMLKVIRAVRRRCSIADFIPKAHHYPIK